MQRDLCFGKVTLTTMYKTTRDGTGGKRKEIMRAKTKKQRGDRKVGWIQRHWDIELTELAGVR